MDAVGKLRPCEEENTTTLLNRWAGGDLDAASRLMQKVYPKFLRMAAARKVEVNITDRPSDLAQELFMRLSDQRVVLWEDRAHFFAVAGRLIRRIVIDRLRHRSRLKRQSVDPIALKHSAKQDQIDLIALDQALNQLAQVCPLSVKIVELRFFAGLNLEETADTLAVSRATVIRRWRFARASLKMMLD